MKCVNRHRQHGASLIVSLLMLIAVAMLSTSAAQIALQDEKASRNDSDRQVAMQAAEAALSDAERDIEKSSRSRIFAPDSMEGFSADCGSAQADLYLGLCLHAALAQVPVWQTVDLMSDAESVAYGHFTERHLQTGAGLLPARLPRYVIELISFIKRDEATGKDDITYFYRITAIGFGLRETTQVVLQTFYRKAGKDSIVPTGRFGRREIPNWKELHDASAKT